MLQLKISNSGENCEYMITFLELPEEPEELEYALGRVLYPSEVTKPSENIHKQIIVQTVGCKREPRFD